MRNTFLLHALPEVLQLEGGYSDNPNDSGGPTNRGITQAVYNEYRKSHNLQITSVKYITPSEVADIYKSNYWDVINGDLLPFPIDWVTFDAAVNMGPVTAEHFLDAALELPASAGVDAKVIADAKAACTTQAGTHTLKEKELSLRIARYHEIADTYAHDQVFLQGWLNRVSELDKAS